MRPSRCAAGCQRVAEGLNGQDTMAPSRRIEPSLSRCRTASRVCALPLAAVLAGACAGPLPVEEFVAGSAAPSPGFEPSPSFTQIPIGDDRLATWWFRRDGGAERTFVLFDGTPSGGVRTHEPLIERLVGAGGGDVVLVERAVARADTFEDLAVLHAELLAELAADGQLADEVVFVAFSFGAQIAWRTALALEVAAQLGDRDALRARPDDAVFLSPSLGPRRDEEVPSVDRRLVRFAWLPDSFLRGRLSVAGIAEEYEKSNPTDEVPEELAVIAYDGLRLRHGVAQTAGLTREELSLAGPPARWPSCLGGALAVFGAADPGFGPDTQGGYARDLGLSVVVVPDAGHHAHTFAPDPVWAAIASHLGLGPAQPGGRNQPSSN
jgi:pimeloyl-ACP methyl ester carboxylesterase